MCYGPRPVHALAPVLCAAARYGQLDILHHILQHSALAADAAGTTLTEALHHGVMGHHKPVVEHLAKRKADVNQVDQAGWSPMARAAREGHIGMLSLLVQLDGNAAEDMALPHPALRSSYVMHNMQL